MERSHFNQAKLWLKEAIYLADHEGEDRDKYSFTDNEPSAVIHSRYYVALRDAVDEIEGIDRSPKEKRN